MHIKMMNFMAYELHLNKAFTKRNCLGKTSCSSQCEVAQFFPGRFSLNTLDITQ